MGAFLYGEGTDPCGTKRNTFTCPLLHEGLVLFIYLFIYFFIPIVSVACPTGPHPPLRLARRPNRGHIGGGGWTVIGTLSRPFLTHGGIYVLLRAP